MRSLCLLLLLAPRCLPQPNFDLAKLGPAVGASIPFFEAPDQNGRKQTFESIRGPKGALLLFHRSADW